MYQRTYDRIIEVFRRNHGYLNFESLKEEGVTVLQMRELEDLGELERFARGWYWCNKCGYDKPADYKYVEIGLVDPDAVICLDSACYLGGIDILEPETIKFAVPRSDRRKYGFDFATCRYFYTHMEEKYIKTIRSEYGVYRYFAPARAVTDSINSMGKIEECSAMAILEYNRTHKHQIDEYKKYLSELKQAERKERKG